MFLVTSGTKPYIGRPAKTTGARAARRAKASASTKHGLGKHWGEESMKAETKFDVEYQPTEDEPFMNPRQLDYFRRKLLAWKASILAESRGTIEQMQEGTRNIPDI